MKVRRELGTHGRWLPALLVAAAVIASAAGHGCRSRQVTDEPPTPTVPTTPTPVEAPAPAGTIDAGGATGDAGQPFIQPSPDFPQSVVVERDGVLWALILDDGVLYRINLDTMKLEGAVPYREGATANDQIMDELMPMFHQGQEKARQAACMSNLKQIGLAARLYAEDHDQKLPSAAWPGELQPYLKNAALYTCPSRADLPVAYAMNEKVVGVSQGDLARPAETIMFFEGNAGGEKPVGGPDLVPDDGIHNHGINACFADGHCKWLPVDQAKQILGQPVS